MKKFWLLIAIAFFSPSAMAGDVSEARKLVALYDSKESSPKMTFVHRFLEMPANHIGYDIHYYDIHEPLPVLGDDVKGVVIWFSGGNDVPDAKTYLDWLQAAINQKKKLIIIENAGIGEKDRNKAAIMQQYNHILSYIGIQDSDQWHAVTYRTRLEYIDKSIAGFEREIGPVFPPYGDTHVIPGRATSHLKLISGIKQDEDSIDLITTSTNGGYIAEGYAIFHVVENDESKISQWFVNPFLFLRSSLNTSIMPIPDVTTLNGKRIFYGHIDGDGWNNLSEMLEHRENPIIAAEVIKDSVLMPYRDFAFSVGLIISDVETDCYGIRDSERVAREIFALPNVEPSSHTHSHPLYWRYFADYTPEKEKPLLGRYPPKPKNKSSLMEDLKDSAAPSSWTAATDQTQYYIKRSADLETDPGKADRSNTDTFTDFGHRQYETPRSYACSPFQLSDEITGSIERVNNLSPPGKKARLIQWSGDTSPFLEALKLTREAGYYNINGGDSRFDNEYPSYSSVAPIGLNVRSERQIYSSNSNENTYTNLWTGRFFGFRYLQTTVQNTEQPIRVRPFNVYFHMYSGQKEASLLAVKENLNYARTQNVIPITATDYAMIANGFYAARITQLADNRWKIENRDAMQTMRFDSAADRAVDFTNSEGILGQNYYAGNLYVSLNPEHPAPIISLKNNNNSSSPPDSSTPYLIESRWAIKNLHFSKSLLTIQALGYGSGDMVWKMPESGNYLIKALRNGNVKPVFSKSAATTSDGILSFRIEAGLAESPLTITIEKTEK